MRCGNQKVIGTLDSLLLYGSRYVSDILAAIGLCLYGGMCQIRRLAQVSASMEYVTHTLAAADHRSLSLWRYVLDMLAATGLCLYGGMCTTI